MTESERRNHPSVVRVIDCTAIDQTSSQPIREDLDQTYFWGPLVDPKGDPDRVWGVD